MPRPNPRAPGEGQDALFDTGTERIAEARAGVILRGRHSKATDRALTAALRAELISDVDGAAATALRGLMWSLDAGEAQNKPYLASKAVPAITELLRELHMTPESRGTDTEGDLAALAAQLGQIRVDDDEPALPDAPA